MGETSTKNLFAVTNNMIVKEKNATENLDADELIFYHSLRTDMALLEKKPKLQTIHHILDYSKSLR
ncbi:hypothetical protein GCM10023149_53620 [Mucilaginibacter gynuensis]|uniref:Uncharacterized protein n=1 Tax=Mucilaginibacter gynuensis TaxID=1302236 RepID=A0ABP8HMK8_9SPHI